MLALHSHVRVAGASNNFYAKVLHVSLFGNRKHRRYMFLISLKTWVYNYKPETKLHLGNRKELKGAKSRQWWGRNDCVVAWKEPVHFLRAPSRCVVSIEPQSGCLKEFVFDNCKNVKENHQYALGWAHGLTRLFWS